MRSFPEPLDLSKVRASPLAQRKSLNRLEDALVSPASTPRAVPAAELKSFQECVRKIRSARERGASVMLVYGAHLIKNGLMAVVNELVRGGWITHLATNGAGAIHDWEFAFQGKTEESVRDNVATGSFGTWDETGRAIQLALLAGALKGEGFGRSMGRFIAEDGAAFPSREELERLVREDVASPLAPARVELLAAMARHKITGGKVPFTHPHKATSILFNAFEHNVPFTVHPGIGYDIYSTHPTFNGAVIGRAGAMDFALFGRAVDGLDNGVVLSVGSAIMAPQVFEKSLSVVNNLRLQSGRKIVAGHSIFVVDIQDGGGWDWSQGEPPKDNPAYYLRFCKTYARMHGTMRYVQCDNRAFLHNLLKEIS